MTYFDPGPRPARVEILDVEAQVDIARSRKAHRLALLLIQYSFSRDDVKVMNGDDWKRVAAIARVNPPHSPETIEAVLYEMELYDRLTQLRRELAMRRAITEVIRGRH